MTKTHSKKICEGYEPIPGYVLEEMIGQGGFGEVWRAKAPGGLSKAVKFVFGTQDQSRASRELRSLERIKGVQHPFLLTLERFEAVDDQLVIVTELADCSLEDVFERNRERGSCGIPRDKLMSHVHDAADALDYLHQRYQLQHLDIKPGNLLLVGGHVKVADFGLLKDLRDVECSVVGGLTPIYAPPEIFDGRPSMHSDQYSLAVMYQELLTGTRPFGGRTIAQLATQHVHSAPNLEPLPASDRPVVARALEKNPERRFPNCLAFVEALRNPGGRSTTVANAGEELSSSDTKVTIGGINAAAPIEDLPQLNSGEQTASSSSQHHAIVVALGGTGAECLRELRRRAADVHSATTLDLHSVLIDTDMSTIHAMRVGEVSDRIPPCKTIHTPLKTAHEYRENGTERLRTISRRWIYNVPRSGATEGMRPLGRLALVDHGPAVEKLLGAALNALAESSGGSAPAVYVVGSLTGGTASGMYIDVVHLLRHLLDQSGLVESPILSILSTAPMQVDPNRPLALHDAQAAMTEIQHFLQAGNGYPGDAGAGWSSVPAARTPMHNVYVVAESRTSLAPSAVDTMTEYIWSDATGSRRLLADARKLEISEESSIVPPSIRSVGVVNLADSDFIERKVLAPHMVREMLIEWLGLPSTARQKAGAMADRIVRRCGLSAQVLIRKTTSLLCAEDRDKLCHATSADEVAALAENLNDPQDFEIAADELVKQLRREVTVALTDRRADATTVMECLRLVSAACDSCADDLKAVAEESGPVMEPERAVMAASSLLGTKMIGIVRQEANQLQERLERFATTLAMSIVELSKIVDAGGRVDLLDAVQPSLPEFVAELHAESVHRFLLQALRDTPFAIDAKSMVEEITELAVPLATTVVKQNQEMIREGILEDSQGDVSATISSNVTRPFDNHTQTAVTYELPTGQDAGDNDQPLTVEDALVVVKPTLLSFGGLQRLILVVGSEQERSQFEPRVRELHEGALTVAVVPGETPKLIHEAQQVELANILSRMTILNGGNAQITRRLASRTDISW